MRSSLPRPRLPAAGRAGPLVLAGLLALWLLPAGAAAAAESADGAVAPAGSRHVVRSFDGTPIVANLFLPPGADEETPAELVLATHGWGGTGQTELEGLTAQLVADGYAVLTWDQRGFGCSGGRVRIDDPQVEGRDVSALIDWAMANAPVRTVDDDPVVGMVGISYAGGIQTAAAAVDERIDALAPDMSWSDLRHSLYPGGVVKQGWVALLYALGTLTAEGQGLDPGCEAGPQPDSGLDPVIHQGVTEFVTTGTVPQDVLDFFAGSSLAVYGEQHPVDVPTLVLQSPVDTLFDLTDGLGIVEHVRAQGADARLLVYCGGHVNCPSTYAEVDDVAHLDAAVRDWFAVHLRGEQRPARPAVEYRTNAGEWRRLDRLPDPADGLSASGTATDLPVVPVLDVPDAPGLLQELTAGGGRTLPATPLTAARVAPPGDPRAASFEVARAQDGPLELVGVPEVEVTVAGTLLESLAQLPSDELADALGLLEADGLAPVTDAAGEVVGVVPVAGGLLEGVLDGVGGTTPSAVVPEDVHVFVKLVHREAGEVVNLQETPVRVAATGGPRTVTAPMAGVAYTIPEGDHLDLEISTASLVHATGRLPAVVDVAVDAAVPVVAATDGPDADDPQTGGGAPEGDGDAGSATAGDALRGSEPGTSASPGGAGPDRMATAGTETPATGGGAGLALAGLACLGAGWRLRRARAVPARHRRRPAAR